MPSVKHSRNTLLKYAIKRPRLHGSGSLSVLPCVQWRTPTAGDAESPQTTDTGVSPRIRHEGRHSGDRHQFTPV